MDIKLNGKKTKNLAFGGGSLPSHRAKLNDVAIPWEEKCKYLGGKFYRALNSIIQIEGRSDDMVMLRLLEAHCIPILAYAIEIVGGYL